MDAPIASLILEGFCKGYEKQAKIEEEEAEDIVKGINPDALRTLCTRYDNKIGELPEHEHEGEAVFEFFEKLKDNVKKGKGKQKEVKRK